MSELLSEADLAAKPSVHAELIGRLRDRAYALAAASPLMETDTLRNTRLLVEAANAIEALTASLSRVEGESAWQPIETAPRDETWIELWWPDTEAKVHAGFWSNTGPNDWYRSEADSHPMRDYFDGQPTHWRAIREPLGLSRADDASGNEGEGQ